MKRSGHDRFRERHLDRYGEFFHPLTLGALGLLVLNDHYLKGSQWLPAALTGKLSDFSGLVYFPLFLTALSRFSVDLLGTAWPPLREALAPKLALTPHKLLACCVGTGLFFVALKLCRPVTEAYIAALGLIGRRANVVADPSDVWALLSLVVAYRIGRSQIGSNHRPSTKVGTVRGPHRTSLLLR